MTSIFLENERIYMRTLSGEDDFREYEKWLNDQENTVYMGSGKFPVTVDSLKKYVENFAGNQNGMLLGIFLKGKDEHIGNITLQQINWKDRNGEVGVIIGDKEQWGKGYATDAIKLVAEHAFKKLNLHKIYAGVVDGNMGSKKAFKKVGFKEEAVLREHFYLNGEYQDCSRLGLLASEYVR